MTTAARLLGRDPDQPAPYAVCRVDKEPLISTFEFRGYEFVCVVCDRKYGFLSPEAAAATPELEARHAELKAQYETQRAERAAARA